MSLIPPATPAFRRHRSNALRAVLSPLSRAMLSLQVEGEERIPLTGPCLLVFNHLSNLDPHLLFTRVRRPDATGLVAASYRERFLARLLVEAGGGMWLRRDSTDRLALHTALRLLGSQWLVGLAPEGRRSPDGKLRRGRGGAAFLALRSGAPVLPIGIDGTDRILQDLRRGRRSRVTIRIGLPFRPAVREGARGQDIREAATDEIMSRIAELLPPERRGAYTDALIAQVAE